MTLTDVATDRALDILGFLGLNDEDRELTMMYLLADKPTFGPVVDQAVIAKARALGFAPAVPFRTDGELEITAFFLHTITDDKGWQDFARKNPDVVAPS